MGFSELREWARTSALTGKGYRLLKEGIRRERRRRLSSGPHRFLNRQRGERILLLVIAGYKPWLYRLVFPRLKSFLPDFPMDLCLLSSGRFDPELSELAKDWDCSYLSTKRNCVTLAQNMAIELHPEAEFIFKMDEDIFVTKGCFEALLSLYRRVEEEGPYRPGLTAPLIPVNGYGYRRLLTELSLLKRYEEKFERPLTAAGREYRIESDPAAARFFWGEGGEVPPLDALNRRFSGKGFRYEACPVRFSIGFILFRRSLWEEMGRFPVRGGSCMGLDEDRLCSFCMTHSRAILVSENTVVGHFSFGKQTEGMRRFLEEHPERFLTPGEEAERDRKENEKGLREDEGKREETR